MVTVKWLGCSGLEFRCGGSILLVDPYLSRPSKWKSLFLPLKSDERAVAAYLQRIPGALAGILVGHTHSDHVLDVPALVAAHGSAKAYGTASLANLLSAYGLGDKAVVVNSRGESCAIGPFELRAVPSRHGRAFLGRVPFPGEIARGLEPPLRMHQYRHGGPLLWHVRAGGRTFLHAGTADCVAEALRGLRADVLFVCAAGRQKSPGFLPTLLETLGPEVVVPIHFDDFFAPLRPGRPPKRLPGVGLDRFAEEVRRSGSQATVIVPEPFAEMQF